MNGQSRPVLAWFVDASLVMALASLPLVLAMWWTVSRHPWFLVLVAVVALNAAALAWLRGASERLGPATTMCVLCGLQWATAVLVTWIEPWSMHITPLASVAPLAVAPQAMDRRRLAELAMAGVGVLIVIAAVGRFTPGFGLHDATSVSLRNVVSVGWVGAFTILVSASSWYSYGALAADVERLAESRRRLLSAAARSGQLFEQRLTVVRDALVELRGGLCNHPIRPDSPPPPAEWLTGLRLELARATELLRELGHGLVGIGGAQDDAAATVRLVGQRSPHRVNVEFRVGQRLPHDVASALVAIVAEATGPGAWRGVAPAPAVDVEVRELSSRLVVLLVRFGTDSTGSAGTPLSAGEGPPHVGSIEDAPDGRTPGLDPIVVEVIGDHAAACDGDVEILDGVGGPELVVRLPLDAKLPDADPGAGGNVVHALPADTGLLPVARAFRPLLVFPVLMPLVAGALALTVLRSQIMTIITALAVAFYGLPAFVASRIARRRPFIAGLICTLSAGLVGVFVVSRLNFVRLWAMPLLVSPGLAVLPYVTRRAFAWLTTLATVGTMAVFTAGRLGREDPVAERSPELLNDIIAVTLVPAAFAGLVLVLHRNQTGLLQVGTALRLSRRRVIAVMAETRRRLERDLHDGAQQRLIAAGIRLQIVERTVATGDDAARNLELAAGELDAALVALADVESIAAPAALGVGGLGDALRSVATASPLPVAVEFDVPATLDDRLAAAVYLSCCECLTNSAKHGGPAVSVLVSVGLLGEMLEFRVIDDGRGFHPSEAEVSGGAGLRNIRHRLGALGGELAVASSRAGTIVHGSVPLSPSSMGGRDLANSNELTSFEGRDRPFSRRRASGA